HDPADPAHPQRADPGARRRKGDPRFFRRTSVYGVVLGLGAAVFGRGFRTHSARLFYELQRGRRLAHPPDREAGRVLRRASRARGRGGGERDVLARRGSGVGLPLPGGAMSGTTTEAPPTLSGAAPPATLPDPTAPPRDTSRPLPFLRAARGVFDLS